MSDKWRGAGPYAGATSVSIDVVLTKVLDGTELTAKAAAGLTAYYWRQGGTPTAITLSDLAAINSAWSSGGVKEADATNMKGSYRLDVPDAAFATGADWVEVDCFASDGTSFVAKERFALDVAVTAIQAKAASLTFTNAGKVDAAVLAANDFAQAAADKVWATAARTLTSFGTLVSDIWNAATRTLTAFGFTVNTASSVWDELAASHNTSGTMGQKMNSAAAASDPLLNAVPGAYAAGTAGYTLGNLANNTADITAIKTKTDQLTFTTPNVVDASGGATPAAVAAAVFNTVMTEGYAADGAPGTLAQLMYMLWAAAAAEKVISGTSMTVKKLDGTTTAMTFTLNDPTNPTSITRSS